MNNYDEKITAIKENQKKLLIMVKSKIQEENEIFNLNTKNIVDVLSHDEKTIKKYEAVINAQKLIEEYTNEILNANSIEEIVEIRKKLNGCINKIKKEMRNRGIDDVEYNKYCEDANKLRKKISANIRFLKREEKIKEIELLNNNIDNLNEDELLRLKKLVKNEVNYGNRNLNEDYFNKTIVTRKKKKNQTIEEDTDNEMIKTLKSLDFGSVQNNSVIKEDFETFNNLHEFLDSKVESYNYRYNIEKMGLYTGGIIKNIIVFNKNLPKLINNKKKSKMMLRDFNYYVRKPELLGYGDYVYSHSSIINNFKRALTTNVVLKSKEVSYAKEHEKVINWIIDFCKSNNMEIKYDKTISV